ncbi:MAG: VOC family protein [Gammaproteobacteria bacterium]|nr:VOC family protein [Gammaproteobacteria bacterium]
MTESTSRAVRFQRANFIVTDLDRALILYRDILGLCVEFIDDSEPDSYSYPVFAIDKQAQLKFAVLSTRDQPRVMALTEVRGIEIPPQEHPRRAAIVLDIADIDGVLADCNEHGFFAYPEECLETHDGRIGREVGIVDDDGNLAVIYYIPPSN